jgi:hypothetical protein
LVPHPKTITSTVLLVIPKAAVGAPGTASSNSPVPNSYQIRSTSVVPHGHLRRRLNPPRLGREPVGEWPERSPKLWLVALTVLGRWRSGPQGSVPHSCHIGGRPGHAGSHSRATRVDVDLRIRTLQQAGQCPPKQSVTGCSGDLANVCEHPTAGGRRRFGNCSTVTT